MTGTHGRRRGQRLSVARRLPSAVPDARQGPLAHRRHPAGRLARRRTMCSFDAVLPSLRGEAGAGLSIKSCTWFSTYRIHHRCASALPRPPLLPARRRRAHPQPGRRARHEHRPAGRLQSGLEAGAGRRGTRPTPALLDSYEEERLPVAQRLLETTDRAFRLVVSDSWLAGLLRTKILAQDRGIRDELRARAADWRSARSRRPASTIARARCRNR